MFKPSRKLSLSYSHDLLAPTCDIFCTVIDNFGDIGICWRLARQLATEYGWQVKLWVDQLTAFAKLCPAVNPKLAQQCIDHVVVKSWQPEVKAKANVSRANTIDITAADIVIEAFGCDLPLAYIGGMVKRAKHGCAPVWINLEYLGLNDWVPDFHGRPSPHPRYPLTKTCFFPGLQPGTGGVLKERMLLNTRQTFLDNRDAQAALWASLRLPPLATHAASTTTTAAATVVSLFTYENPALQALLARWCQGAGPVVCIVPEGCISAAMARFFGRSHFLAGDIATRGQLTVHGIPFIDQDTYDRLLWICDINFVRGEDSFVRAQWAQRPLVWQAYPQHDQAHLVKLEAVLSHYTAGLPSAVSHAFSRFWRIWNSQRPSASISHTALALYWDDFWQHREALARQASAWAQTLAAVGDLTGHLVQFCERQLCQL